jgi:hydrogenase maturation factor
LEKLTSRVSRGAIELASMGLTGETEIYEKAPNRSSMFINVDGLGVIQQTFDGAGAWLQDPLQGYVRFSGLASAKARREAEFQKEIRFKELNPGLALIGKEKIGDRDAYVLESTNSEKWYFDVQSGLLLRKGTTYYEDYREVDGVKLPFTMRDDSGFGIVVRLSEIKHNVVIDPEKFVEYPDCFTNPEQDRRQQKTDSRIRP